MHILVIDDDDRLRLLLKDFLKKNNFKVSVSPNAINAKKLLTEFIFDLIILDVMMPKKTGIELINELGSEFKTPILLLTALDQIDDKIKGLKSGADDYLTKPFDPEELLLRINNILKRTNLSQIKTPKLISLIFILITIPELFFCNGFFIFNSSILYILSFFSRVDIKSTKLSYSHINSN